MTPRVIIKDAIEPKPLTRSMSNTGLSSLSKSIIEQESKIIELDDMVNTLKEILIKYELQVHELIEQINKQDVIIKEYEKTLEECKQEIQDIWNL